MDLLSNLLNLLPLVLFKDRGLVTEDQLLAALDDVFPVFDENFFLLDPMLQLLDKSVSKFAHFLMPYHRLVRERLPLGVSFDEILQQLMSSCDLNFLKP